MLVLDFVTITLLLWMWDELGNSVSKGSRSRFFRQSKSDWISNRYLCLTVLIASRLFDFSAAFRSELGFMSSWDNLSLFVADNNKKLIFMYSKIQHSIKADSKMLRFNKARWLSDLPYWGVTWSSWPVTLLVMTPGTYGYSQPLPKLQAILLNNI